MCCLPPQATVEPIIYAPLAPIPASQNKSDGEAVVDQNQVTYAVVDTKATKKLAAQRKKATTLPTNSPPPGELHAY